MKIMPLGAMCLAGVLPGLARSCPARRRGRLCPFDAPFELVIFIFRAEHAPLPRVHENIDDTPVAYGSRLSFLCCLIQQAKFKGLPPWCADPFQSIWIRREP